MGSRIDEHAERLKSAVKRNFEEWKADNEAFIERYPGIFKEYRMDDPPAVNAMRSIANEVMMGSRFDWNILEVVFGDPVFAIGQYNPDKPER